LSSAAGSHEIQPLGRVGDDAVELFHVGDAGVVVRLDDDLSDLVAVETGVVLLHEDDCAEDHGEDQADQGQSEGLLDVLGEFIEALFGRCQGHPCGVIRRVQGLEVGDDALLQSLLGSIAGQ